MGTATVIGRDELGRIIDVQVTTEEDIAPPGPETVSAGGGVQTVRLLGPFPISFETDNISSFGPAYVTDLDAGTIVLRAWIRNKASWGTDNDLYIGAGGSGWLTNGDYQNVTKYPGAALVPLYADSGAYREPPISLSESPASLDMSIVQVLTDGALVAYTSGVATQGSADVYALIAEPA